MEFIDKIKDHLSKGETDKAIKLLVDYTKENKPNIHDEAVLLSGQFRQWKREIALGVQQSSSELRRIEMGIMDLINDETIGEKIDTTTTPSKRERSAIPPGPAKKSKLIPIVLGALAIVVLGLIFVIMDHDTQEHVPTSPEMSSLDEENNEAFDEGLSESINNAPEGFNEAGEEGFSETVNNADGATGQILSDASGTINGYNLKQVAFGGANTNVLGYFRDSGNETWQELGPDQNAKFIFEETFRDDWSVYLLDENRNMEIQIDLETNQINLSRDGGPMNLLYHIKAAE